MQLSAALPLINMPCLADLKATSSMLIESCLCSSVLQTCSPHTVASGVLVISVGCMAWHTMVAPANDTDEGI